MTKIKGMIAWHNGNAILLNGETEVEYGAEWYLGEYVVGALKGKTAVVIAGTSLEDYKDAKDAIEEEQKNYEAFFASV